jgi:acyl-CoA synthetase (AMP-forming)/AMP-acid ligase II
VSPNAPLGDPKTATTLAELIRVISAANGDDHLTFRQLDQRSRDLARGLLRRGVGKGSRIGFLFGNSSDWLMTWAAIVRIGAIAVPLSTFYRGLELARVLRQSDVTGLITTRMHLGVDFLEQLTAGFPVQRVPLRTTCAEGSEPPLWIRRPLSWHRASSPEGSPEVVRRLRPLC